MRALLEVNVLIALLDSDHLHHGRAKAWLKENIKHGWASCPLTQNGCIRIMSQPAYPNALPAAAVAERLAAATATLAHALQGQGNWLFVTGPAGIGKTVFVESVVAAAARIRLGPEAGLSGLGFAPRRPSARGASRARTPVGVAVATRPARSRSQYEST